MEEERYRILKKIGEGATAEVFLAYDAVTDRRVAIKCGFRRGLLQREARMQAMLSHSAFPCLYDYAEREGKSLLFMEYIEGENLKQRRHRIRFYRQQEAVRIVQGTAEALLPLHEAQIPFVYGDIKPEHILLQPDGKLRLVDLGAAVAADRDSPFKRGGTPGYVPPETWSGRPDPRNDIYALGKLMQMLMEDGKSLPSPGYRAVAERCVQRDPAARYRSLREFLAAMRKIG